MVIFKLLLNDPRLDPNKEGFFKTNILKPLYLACEKENSEYLQILLNDSRIDTKLFHDLLLFACQISNEKSIQIILNNKNFIITNTDMQLFNYICKKKYIECIKVFMNDIRFDLNVLFNDETAFFSACRYENIDIIKLLIDCPQIDINKKCYNRTPFEQICMFNQNIDIIKILLKSPRLIINKENYNIDFLKNIYCGNRIDIIKLLMSSNKLIHIFYRDIFYSFSLLLYISKEICNFLLNSNMFDINHQYIYTNDFFCCLCITRTIDDIIFFLNTIRFINFDQKINIFGMKLTYFEFFKNLNISEKDKNKINDIIQKKIILRKKILNNNISFSNKNNHLLYSAADGDLNLLKIILKKNNIKKI